MSEKITKIMEDIKALTLLEASELVKALEEEFGVSAAAPMAMMAAPAGGGEGGGGAEEKSEFNVVLAEIGDKKMDVIKAVREITGLGLKESKEMVDGAPSTVKENVGKDEAEEIKKKLEEAGAKIELK